RSQPRPCQSMSALFQSITWLTERASASMRYTPPWLSPCRLPRTTDVVMSFMRPLWRDDHPDPIAAAAHRGYPVGVHWHRRCRRHVGLTVFLLEGLADRKADRPRLLVCHRAVVERNV